MILVTAGSGFWSLRAVCWSGGSSGAGKLQARTRARYWTSARWTQRVVRHVPARTLRWPRSTFSAVICAVCVSFTWLATRPRY